MRKVIAILALLATLSVAGVAAADYYIKQDTVEPCTNWSSATFENGQRGYVCSTWPYFRVDVPDAYDTIYAIDDLTRRVRDLEAEIAALRTGAQSCSQPQ